MGSYFVLLIIVAGPRVFMSDVPLHPACSSTPQPGDRYAVWMLHLQQQLHLAVLHHVQNPLPRIFRALSWLRDWKYNVITEQARHDGQKLNLSKFLARAYARAV